MKDYIKEKLLSYADNEYMRKYIEICEFYQNKPTKITRFQYHHIFPSFLFKENINGKNRASVINELDATYLPEDNVVKLPGKFHLYAHFVLGLALKTKEAINAFQIFIDDYETPIDNYTKEEALQLGQMFQDTLKPNTQEFYMSEKEKKEYYKQKEKEYKEKLRQEHLAKKNKAILSVKKY